MAPRTIFQRGRPNGSGTAGRRTPSTVKPAIVAIRSVEISERGRELPISGIDPYAQFATMHRWSHIRCAGSLSDGCAAHSLGVRWHGMNASWAQILFK